MSNEIISYLRRYSTVEHPLKGVDIANHFGTTGVKVRKAVNEARCSGVPICSSSFGYYYSEDKELIRKTVESMLGRIAAQQNAIAGLEQLLEKKEPVQ